MTKPTKPRRSARQKLLDEVTQARQLLHDTALDRRNAAVEQAMYPSAERDELFGRYSRALRALVRYDLTAPGWALTEEIDSTSSWKWDSYNARFYFDYETFADLPRVEDECANFRAPRIRCSAHLTLDPAKPIDDELNRLAVEAKHYRDSIALMEREVYRLVVRAGRDAEQNQEPS